MYASEFKRYWVNNSLSPDSIFSVIFSFIFKGLQSSTSYNDLISCVPFWKRYEGESISNQPNLFPVELHLFFFDVIAL